MSAMYKIKDSDELEEIMLNSNKNSQICNSQTNLLKFLSPKILMRRNAVNEDEIRKALAHLNIGAARNTGMSSSSAMVASMLIIFFEGD
ncbi:hypothetical protein PIROE2DRAFT_15858 [Piromyces sp. E2]|nr:hypothetical protein PIROE2DRAFT_15858 [Piromyces sp. E2]|eukprot:OUM58779.1 hypothetical protein PIROE2DRAFT_15858 [Piromyces sp. E2]